MIGDGPLAASVVVVTGAVEIATHGWDIGRACAVRRPTPDRPAGDLPRVAVSPVAEVDRVPLLAAPVAVPVAAAAGVGTRDQLVVLLGRGPGG